MHGPDQLRRAYGALDANVMVRAGDSAASPTLAAAAAVGLPAFLLAMPDSEARQGPRALGEVDQRSSGAAASAR